MYGGKTQHGGSCITVADNSISRNSGTNRMLWRVSNYNSAYWKAV